MRVPSFPPRPASAITRLSQFKEAGLVLISHCSANQVHEHTIDYDAALLAHGDVEIDYNFKVNQLCPMCGANGGGMTTLTPKH